MSLLRIAFWLILGVDIGLDDTTCRAGMIRCGLPRTIQQFDLAQLQRQFSGEPIGAKPLSLSPPY